MNEGVFIRIGRGVPGVLYRPQTTSRKSSIAVLVMHSDSDYLSFSAGPELSSRGYTVLCANVSDSGRSLDDKLREVRLAVDALNAMPNVSAVVLLGHSGGGTLLSAYQALAENGVSVFQGPEQLLPCPDDLDGFAPADALMLLDSNWGNGAMRLFSLDPAVLAEWNGVDIDSALNAFDPDNGFDPAGSTYPPEFVARFQKAQGDRNNRLIDAALERLAEIESGSGRYTDDEPFIVPGAAQGFRNNKLYAQDVSLMSRTRRPRLLLQLHGGRVEQIVHTARGPENHRSYTDSYWEGALAGTVRTFLNSFAVRTTADYGYDADTVTGIDWSSSYNCTTGNVAHITVPLLVMGMTAGWEFAAAETIHDNAGSADKTLAYVEGADHLFRTAPTVQRLHDGSSDTQRHTYDFVDEWIAARMTSFGVPDTHQQHETEQQHA